MRNRLFFITLALSLPAIGFGQGSQAPLNRDYHHLVDRYEIKSGVQQSQLFTSVKPLGRKSIAQMADSLLSEESGWSEQDLANLWYLANDNWEYSTKSRMHRDNRFMESMAFRSKEDLIYTGDKKLILQANPVFFGGIGMEPENQDIRFLTTAGAEMRSILFQKLSLYGYMAHNFALFPGYVQEKISEYSVIPMEGRWDTLGNHGNSFFTPRFSASMDVAKHINIQVGRDRNFIGNGHRSMILSDFANNSVFLKVNTKLGRFNYTMLQNVLKADAYNRLGASEIGTGFPTKYQAFHRLGIDIGKNFNLGIFETVVYGRERANGRNPIEISYMVPAIFFRATEQQIGSADNALLGLDWKYNFLRSFSFYGQVNFDEFVLKELTAGEGWWANKFGIQAGLKYVDVFGVDNLDLQLEGNISRPYNYTHRDNFASYTHFLQPLAHPFGANFKEVLAIVRYQPKATWFITARGFVNQFGADTDNTNFGSDVLKPYTSRENNYGNFIGQGISTTVLYTDFTLSKMIKHNLFVDLRHVFRMQSSDIPARDNTTNFTQFSIRLHIPHRDHDF
jgi:hypothetical protein